ncbi:MAG: VCBS domain-containing protein, partial [Pseudomonadota bacterium]
MLDNVIASRLYRPGSVAYVSKSGGLSNELNNIIANNTDGVYEVTVTVNDNAGGIDTQAISVTVTDTNDAPVITSANTVSVAENQTSVIAVTY